ncbi:MAG: hypothetical protein ACXQT5_02095 [Candidatus Syntropharchaeia archaeon]
MNPIDLLKELIRIPTYEDTYEAISLLEDELRKNEFEIEVVGKEKNLNIVAEIGSGKPKLVFNSHVDTVPPIG